MPDPFITTEDLSDWLEIDANNARGTIAVEGACGVIRTISEQQITRGTSTEVLDGSGTEIQLLREYPVGSITSVEEDAESLTEFDYVLNDAMGSLVRVPAEKGYVSSNTTLRPTVVWNRGYQNIEVVYEHGWEENDIPPDLKMAALSISTRLFNRINSGISSESLGQYSVNLETEADEVTSNEDRIIRKYKRER